MAQFGKMEYSYLDALTDALWIDEWFIYLFGLALLQGLIGSLIGRHRGRPTAGFFFGLFLGIFGWLIVALGPDLRNKS